MAANQAVLFRRKSGGCLLFTLVARSLALCGGFNSSKATIRVAEKISGASRIKADGV